MDHASQVAHLERLLEMIETRTTAMAETEYRNPVSDYTCADQFARERAELFRGLPLLVGLSCEVREPGAYLTDDGSGIPVLVVRGDDGVLRAFANVCRHRGTKLLRGCGVARKRISCPYHAWSYTRDGRLAHVPFEQGFEGVELARYGLTPLPIAERCGMVFVRPDPSADAIDIDGFLAGLTGDFAHFGIEGHHHYETRTLRQRMNWKLVIDTFLETYHLGALHKTTVYPILHGNVGTFDAFGPHLRNMYVRRSVGDLRELPRDRWNLIEQTAIVYVLFPNTVFVMQGDHIETWRVYPDGDDPNFAEMVVSLYTPEPAESESARRHWDANMDLLIRTVVEEDFPVGEEIQRSFSSGAQECVTYGRNEPALGHFHEQVRRAVGIAS